MAEKKNLVIGIVAHVDAGKTTLSEALLYNSGAIDRLGRVDKADAHLDTYSLERERGITIFSKQAVFQSEKMNVTLVDTPGHVDFACEAERALSIQDYAILVISAPEGVQSHTKTLWQLLRARKIPTFIFVNKCDLSERASQELLMELRGSLDKRAVSFASEGEASFFEEAAGVDEVLMQEFFERESLSTKSIAEAIRSLRLFPVFFGSALKNRGVRELISALDKYTLRGEWGEKIFGGKVYKISTDQQGKRISFVKITGGSLHPKDTLTYKNKNGETVTEKVEQIRIFSADKSKPCKEALPGTVCALYGLSSSFAGLGLGFEAGDATQLSPVLDYQIILSKGADAAEIFPRLASIGEQDPALALRYDTDKGEIRVSLMGEIQLEVLKRLILEKAGLDVSFDEGKILYKETVMSAVHGAGHFEPLRHYAEVHLIIEPMPSGTGVIAAAECDRDTLATNWQRLVVTHIEERVHKGVLTGSPLTDVKITLVAGRAHLKHTEGGDFRRATYRAVRQGLMKAKSVLLEPTFDFRLEIPEATLGRALNDLSGMGAEFSSPEILGGTATVTGNCPVLTMRSYPSTLRAYTRGEGKIYMTVGDYRPAHNAEEVIAEIGYNPELDERNPSSSVFCKAGAGYSVPWQEADELMHVKPRTLYSAYEEENKKEIAEHKRTKSQKDAYAAEKELMEIFERTYGKVKPHTVKEKKVNEATTSEKTKRPAKPKPQGDNYLIIDGYNVIFALPDLKKISDSDLSRARGELTRLMCSYSAFMRVKVIIVFDAYKKEGAGSVERYGAVSVIYTREAQTADSYIEKTTRDIAGLHRVRVVTGDLNEQNIILGHGALRVSPREFKAELDDASSALGSHLSGSI